MTTVTDRLAWFQGGEAQCSTEPETPAQSYHLVLLGPPGVGKGTQAELLCAHLGACHLSTGDVFRAACSGGCAPSLALIVAQEAMRRGELVSDDIVIAIVRERAQCLNCRGGFLLDGFPRTVAQAQALDAILKEKGVELDGVISYGLPLDEIVARLSGRRTCPGCKAVYHLTSRPPQQEGVCDACGTTLIQREDDSPASIRVRMEAYESSTRPLTEYYRAAGKLITVEAEGTPEAILQRTLNAITTKVS